MMVRNRVLTALTLVLAVAATGEWRPARAQYGWLVSPYGWGGGGGSTVQGDIAHGLGNLAVGAGVYNKQTAVANSINADTVMRYNQFMFSAQQESNRRYYERQARRIGKTNATLAETSDRLRNRPEAADIDRGDALNVLLDDLTTPAMLHGSALRQADSEIDARLVREIPFRNAAEAVTICLDQLLDREKFPALLRSEALTPQREAFVGAVHRAAQQAREGGEVSAAAAEEVARAGRALYDRARSPEIVATPAERSEALNYLKAMAGLARVAQSPDIVQKLKDLKELKTTHVYNLVAFMHSHNLRFGPAQTPAQKDAYRKLYPILKADRDELYSAAAPAVGNGPVPPPPDPGASVAEVFKRVDESQIAPPPPPGR